ncbi:MAG: aminoglycoside phosphotransferase family protein [bacterium]|nr:aminoglycoside phosphotransferase family protein [bacterium]
MSLPLTEISELYDQNLSIVEKVAGGFLSENYVLTDGSTKYFLKRHRHTDKNQIEGVCLAEQFFAEGGVLVILPVHTKQDERFFAHGGGFYSLYQFVDGHHIERGKLTESAAVSLGSTLAVLHRRGKDSSLKISEQFNAWDTDKFLSRVAAIETEVNKEQPLSEFGSMVLESLRLKKRAVAEERVSFDQLGLSNDHLIHGDYFCDNVFFGKNDEVSYVFDFEKTQYAPPMYELFRSMFVSFLSIPNQENLAFAKKYIDAYLETHPFPKEVVKNSLMAAYQKQIHSLWIEEEHYLKNSTRPDPLLPSQFACNRYYIENRKEIETYLLG